MAPNASPAAVPDARPPRPALVRTGDIGEDVRLSLMISHTVNVVASDKDWCCATAPLVYFLLWKGPATVARARVCHEALRTFIASSRGGIGIFVVVEDHAPPPDAEARPLFAQAMREAGPRVHGCAYVVLSEGFVGAMKRSAITGLSLLAREPYPTRSFSSLRDGASWLASRIVVSADVPPLTAEIEDIAGALRAR